jgi:putative inorganic carbon (hco3(-)) transporter
MIGFVKGVIKGALPFGLYGAIMAACIGALIGYPLLALGMIAVATPLPNVWYQIQDFPLGKDILDLLVVCGLVGLYTGQHVQGRARSSTLLLMYLVFTYVMVWNSSMRFDLAVPLTASNSVFVIWKNYAQMVLLYFLTYHAVSDEKKQKQIVLICITILFLISLREARNFTEGVSFSYERRLEGPFWIVGLGANHFGAFLVHYGAVALAVALCVSNKYVRWLCIATCAILIQPLFFTYSRGAYVAALAVLVLFGLIKKRSLLVIVGVLFLGWHTLLPTTVVERITMTETSDGQLEASAAERVVVWERAIALYEQHPVFGSGLGSFNLSRAGGRLNSAHSLYLETLAEQGIAGVIFLALVMLKALWSSWLLYVRGQTEWQKALGLGLFGCVISMVITNAFGDRWSYFAIGAYFWIFWGIADRMLTQLSVVPKPVPAVTPAAPIPT